MADPTRVDRQPHDTERGDGTMRFRSKRLVRAFQIVGLAAVLGSGCITVSDPVLVHAVSVVVGRTTLRVGDSMQAVALPVSETGGLIEKRHIAWQSSSAGVVTVSASGVVTAVGVGTAEITATSEGIAGRVTLSITP
jgi:uncharacterized protein YjdB